MHEAARFSRLDIFRCLLSYSADPLLVDIHGSTTLHHAVLSKIYKRDWDCFYRKTSIQNIEPGDICETLKIIKILLLRGLNPHTKNRFGHSPLYLALVTEQTDIATLFLKNLNERISDIQCSFEKETDINDLYLDANIDINKILHIEE